MGVSSLDELAHSVTFENPPNFVRFYIGLPVGNYPAKKRAKPGAAVPRALGSGSAHFRYSSLRCYDLRPRLGKLASAVGMAGFGDYYLLLLWEEN